jgi:large subunit ribosomal protein L10
VAQAAELRSKLREADATFKVVKNSLTERAADRSRGRRPQGFPGRAHRADVRARRRRHGRQSDRRLRPHHAALAVQGRDDGSAETLDADQIRSISRLPSREVLYGQLVGVVASPVTGLVRTLGALVGGLAVALGQVREKKESGEIPAGEAPAAAGASEAAPAVEPAAQEEPAKDEEPAAQDPETPAEEAPAEETVTAEEPSGEQTPEPAAATDDKPDGRFG